jgi:hypothetical protein
MGGFSAQVQPNQSSAPAGKGAGMSAMQMGQDPIETPPLDKMMKMQELQMEQPSFPQGNQMPQDNMGPPLGGLGGLMGGKITMPNQGGQPKLGMPNAYSNTMQPWDNQPQQPQAGGGKGMGGLINNQMSQGMGRTGKGA